MGSKRDSIFRVLVRVFAILGFLAAALMTLLSTSHLAWEGASDYIGGWYPYSNLILNLLGMTGLIGLLFMRKWALYLYLVSIAGEWGIKLFSSYFDRIDKMPLLIIGWGPVITVIIFQVIFLWMLWENRRSYR